MSNPVVFISYSWTSPQHEQWVVDLATSLVEAGVDVRLDKWDLREGQDAHAYMESMVTDSLVSKVIVVSDKRYSEKADKRTGGVGTESQIMSAEIYNKTDQTKFVAVVTEVDERGEPYLPRFFTSRIFIPMTDAQYATNFDQLLRWIYNKPLYVKPALGKMPEFLKDNRATTSTLMLAKRAIDASTSHGGMRANAISTLGPQPVDAYLESLAASFRDFYVDPDATDFPQAVLDTIDAFLPKRNEFIEVIRAAAQNTGSEPAKSLQHFFEATIPFMSRPKHITSWRTWDYDNFIFIVHELFLYAAAVLVKYERFDVLNELIELRFFCPDEDGRNEDSMRPYTIISQGMQALNDKQREMRRISLRAELLEQRSHSSKLSFAEIMAADFILFLRAPSLPEGYDRWYPETLLYSTFRFRGPLEAFARSESKRYFSKLAPLLGLKSKEDLEQLVASYSTDGKAGRWLPRWEFSTLDITGLSNLAKLETRP
jgi:hypothetical protein